MEHPQLAIRGVNLRECLQQGCQAGTQSRWDTGPSEEVVCCGSQLLYQGPFVPSVGWRQKKHQEAAQY